MLENWVAGQNYEVTFVWISSHFSFEGYDKADALVMAGTVIVGTCQFSSELNEFFSVVRTRLRCNWHCLG